MYRTCIFCSADLGTNDSLEAFPVGRSVALDAAKGRLWAICRRCTRWNLAPLEERWEVIEDAERLFRDARMRVHGENVGLARLADGTRLIRVGDALPLERAVWRYGRGLRRRRLRARLQGAAWIGGGLAWLVPPLVLPAAGTLGVASLVEEVRRHRRADELVHRVAEEESPTGRALHLRWRDLSAVRMSASPEGALRLEAWHWREMPAAPGGPVVISGAAAAALLGKALVLINHAGADDRSLRRAVRTVEGAGGSEMLLRGMGTGRYGLAAPDVALGSPTPTFAAILRRMGLTAPLPPRPPTPAMVPLHANLASALALEIALHDETERRAMEGELTMLEQMWRDAEEIASIADRLPDGLPPSEPPRL